MGKKDDSFYLGRLYNQEKSKILDDLLMYNPDDLTTHAVVTGMTGSGKTGLCVGLLEEAALKKYPAIIIDPKGDLTNLVLHFPELLPKDFEPWIDPEAARREGKKPEAKAEEVAALWKNGLSDWNIGKKEIAALSESVEYSIYTPGSSAGIPVNILSSFKAPELKWEENSEILRDYIASAVSGLLSLVGMNEIDPLKSREHILLSNLMEHSFSAGKSLSLTDLILQTQNPPMERLGAFPLENFFPQKDRNDLAMLLNNFLASPSFQTWLEGQSLDIQKILYTEDGKPRHSIFYLAHLDESERMFIVTLLFAAIETWMRAQRGTSGLRALVYFDEVLGYLPPVKNPPSRQVLLRLLKQARAYGVGLVLATQNPVDLDYKALSNAGTWMIGRLQTERDKMRLIEGLQNVGGTLDIKNIDDLISSLDKRVFIMHNVHESGPKLFHTRWVMNYLAGPLTRSQVPALNRLVDAAPVKAETISSVASEPESGKISKKPKSSAKAQSTQSTYFSSHPSVPAGYDEYYLASDLDIELAVKREKIDSGDKPEADEIIYRAGFLLQSDVRYTSRKHNIDQSQRKTVLILDLQGNKVDWEEVQWKSYDPKDLLTQPTPNTQFASPPDWFHDAKKMKNLEKDFVDWIYRTGAVHILANENLDVYAAPGTSKRDFRDQCSSAAQDVLEKENKKIKEKFEKKLDTLQRRIDRQELEIEEAEDEFDQRKMEELGTAGELILSLVAKRRRSLSKTFTKRRMTKQSKIDLEQEQLEMEALEEEFSKLEKDLQEELQAVKDKWAELVDDVTEIPINPYKKDIYLELSGVVWMPYYLVNTSAGKKREAPAFSD